MLFLALAVLLNADVDRIKIVMQFNTELLNLKKVEEPKIAKPIIKPIVNFETCKKSAIEEGRNLVVFTGNKELLEVPGAICYKAKSMVGFPKNCVILFVVKDGSLKTHKCLVGDITADHCLREFKLRSTPKTFKKRCGPNGCQIIR